MTEEEKSDDATLIFSICLINISNVIAERPITKSSLLPTSTFRCFALHSEGRADVIPSLIITCTCVHIPYTTQSLSAIHKIGRQWISEKSESRTKIFC